MPSAPDIRSLEVVLTAACNMRCTYCYQNAKQARSMEWDTLRPALDLLLGSATKSVDLRFIGGEPLLEMPLIQRAVAHVKKRLSDDRRVRFSISTNGTLLDLDAVAFLAEEEFETQLSFDGTPEAQDMRGRGTFEKLDALIDLLRTRFRRFFRRNFYVALTLHGGNLRYLADSVAYFLRKEVPRIRLGALMTHDPSWKLEDIDELDRQFARMFRASLRHLRRTGRVPVDVFRKGEPTDHHHPSDGAMCGAPTGHNLAVDVDGQVTGCVTFAESYQRLPSEFLQSSLDRLRLGKTRDLEFRRRLALYPQAAREVGLFHNKRSKSSSYQRCEACEYVTECSVCPVSIGHIPGNADPDRVPDFSCAYNLISLKYRARFPRQPSVMDMLTGRAPAPEFLTRLRGARSTPRRQRP